MLDNKKLLIFTIISGYGDILYCEHLLVEEDFNAEQEYKGYKEWLSKFSRGKEYRDNYKTFDEYLLINNKALQIPEDLIIRFGEG